MVLLRGEWVEATVLELFSDPNYFKRLLGIAIVHAEFQIFKFGFHLRNLVLKVGSQGGL